TKGIKRTGHASSTPSTQPSWRRLGWPASPSRFTKRLRCLRSLGVVEDRHPLRGAGKVSPSVIQELNDSSDVLGAPCDADNFWLVTPTLLDSRNLMEEMLVSAMHDEVGQLGELTLQQHILVG